jgi:glycosyltransferase A (GT-A) superfamily protein (DUF2064 family)
MRSAVLVMAKAPVPGQVKTRLGARVGNLVAAELAAACILDTLEVCAQVFPEPQMRHLAFAGRLDGARQHTALRARLADWTVHPQHGDGLAARLARAHADVARACGSPVVQVAMDTPQLSPAHLVDVTERLEDGNDAVLGPAADGGWWVLALRDARFARSLRDVQMSTDHTYDDTHAALQRAGARTAGAVTLRDVDTVEDAELAAAAAPSTLFARRWRLLVDGAVR